MIKIKNLTKRYKGNDASTLMDVSALFPDTGLFYVIGKSGSGKSTLLSLIGGMDLDYSGQLKVNGKELKSLSKKEISLYRFQEIAFAFQDFKTDEKETVYHTLYQALAITDLAEEEIKKRIDERLRSVGLLEKKNKKFSSLSGGEKKRISLARALLKDTPILLADEPLSSLNPKLRKEISRLLVKEAKHRLILVVTHETKELDPSGGIYQIKNGNLTLEREKSDLTNRPLKPNYQRIPFRGLRFFRHLLKGIRNKSEFLVITLVSLSISLFSVAFSFLLSDGVKTSLSDSLSDYMNSNSMVITPHDQGYTSSSLEAIRLEELEDLQKRHAQDVLSLSPYYPDDIDSLLPDSQGISLLHEARSLSMKTLSLNSFLNPTFVEEISKEKIYGEKELQEDEVVLGLRESEVQSLYVLLFSRPCPSLEETTLEKIASSLEVSNVALRIQASRNDWSYHLDHSLTLRGISISDTTMVIHSNPMFASRFLRNVLYFKECSMEEEIKESEPWTLHRLDMLIVHPDRIGCFLLSFLQDKEANPFVLYPLRQKEHYQKEIKDTHNRFLVLLDNQTKVHVSDMVAFKKSIEGLKNIRYSTPVYTYTSSGYVRGFSKPFFFSKYKEKLNKIQDNNLYSDEDLGQIQASAFLLPEGVIKGDLLSSSLKDGLRFVTLEENVDPLVYGRKPVAISEIAISSALAKHFFPSEKRALGETLHVLTLEKTEKDGSRYINRFQEGELLITGVYQNDRNALYQDGLFPLAYGIENLDLTYSDLRISQAVIDVDLSLHSMDEYKKLLEGFGDYQGSFPIALVLKELEKTMSALSLFFLAFSLLSMVLSAFLLFLSLYLILQRDRKNIGVLLTLGYTKEEIRNFYSGFAFLVTMIGYLLSVILSIFAQSVLSQTLQEELNLYVFSIHPYFISLAVGLATSLLLSLLLALRIQRIEPLEAFKSKK